MEILEQWPVREEIKIAKVVKLPEKEYLEQINKHLLETYPPLPWRDQLEERRKGQLKELNQRVKNRYEIRLALLNGNEMIGWSYGWQDTVQHGDFYMAASLVLPEYRHQNLYSALVKKILEETKKEGFSAIRSRHVMTNNPIIIAKLKLGFTINGFEQDETMGTLIRMIYYHDKVRKNAAEFRAGNIHHRDILDQLAQASISQERNQTN